MNLWACSCSRTGRRSARIHSASSRASITPCTGENSTAATRPASDSRADDVARELVVRPILDDELDLIRRASAAADCAQSIRSASPDPGHFTSMIRTTPARHLVDAAVAAGLEQHRLPALEQTGHQRIHIALQQRLAAGDLDHRAAVAIDLGQRPRRSTSSAPRETRTACHTTSSADRRPSGARTRTARRRRSIRPGSNGRSR